MHADKERALSDAPSWSYSGETGPERWGELSAEYALARDGMEQSPVNLGAAEASELPRLELSYMECAATLSKKGHLKIARLSPGSSLLIDGSRYALRSLHFHTPAEHTVSEERFAAEAHLVHKSIDDGSLLVLAVFFKEGGESGLITPLITALSSKVHECDCVHQIDPAAILPDGRGYYTYRGSLTTPPCTEGVRWVILKDAPELSSAQIEAISSPTGPTARPVQPLNSRTVLSSL